MAKFLWKMSKKTVRLFLRGIEITVALIIVLLGLFFWRLSVSPMNVDFLVPQLKEHFVPKDLPVNIDVNSIVLRAEVRDEGILHLQIKDLSVLREDGSVITDLPDIELSYGLWRILSLNYMPDALVLKDAFLQAVLDEEGNLYLQSKDTDRERSEETPPIKVSDFNGFIGYLMQFHRLALENAQVLIDDKRQDKQFSVPRLNLLLENDGSDEHVLSVNAEVMAQNQTFNLALQAVFNGKTRQMPFELTFDSLNVSSLRRLIPVLQDAKINIKGGFYGTLDLKNSDKNIRNIISELSFKIINERPGTVNLPAPLTNEYKVDGMLIQGAFAPHLEALKIDKSSLKTGQVQASLEVDITGIGAFLDTQELSHIKTVFKSVVKNVKTEQVPDLWPSALGSDAHAWVKQNLSNGGLKTADFTLYFDGAELVDLFGDIKASGVSVDYLAPMPVVHNVSATVHLYPDKVDIFATSGDLGTIKLKKADLHFTDLQDDISNANMIIEAEGPVKEVMQLIDSKPLEFAGAFGINPAATGGKGTVKTTLNFPLISSLDINQVKVDVSAEIQEGIFPTPIDGENISNGTFDLSVNNNRLELNGTVAAMDQNTLKELAAALIEFEKHIYWFYPADPIPRERNGMEWSPEFHLVLAGAFEELGQTKLATDAYLDALAQDPFNPELFAMCAKAMYQAGDIGLMLTYIEEGLSIDSDHALLNALAALLWCAADDAELAKDYLTIAKAANSSDDEVQNICSAVETALEGGV